MSIKSLQYLSGGECLTGVHSAKIESILLQRLPKPTMVQQAVHSHNVLSTLIYNMRAQM